MVASHGLTALLTVAILTAAASAADIGDDWFGTYNYENFGDDFYGMLCLCFHLVFLSVCRSL